MQSPHQPLKDFRHLFFLAFFEPVFSKDMRSIQISATTSKFSYLSLLSRRQR